MASRSTSQRTNQPSDQPLADSTFQQGGQTTSEIDDAVQVKARHAIDKVQKELSEEAVRHITGAKMMYKPINDDIILLYIEAYLLFDQLLNCVTFSTPVTSLLLGTSFNTKL